MGNHACDYICTQDRRDVIALALHVMVSWDIFFVKILKKKISYFGNFICNFFWKILIKNCMDVCHYIIMYIVTHLAIQLLMREVKGNQIGLYTVLLSVVSPSLVTLPSQVRGIPENLHVFGVPMVSNERDHISLGQSPH